MGALWSCERSLLGFGVERVQNLRRERVLSALGRCEIAVIEVEYDTACSVLPRRYGPRSYAAPGGEVGVLAARGLPCGARRARPTARLPCARVPEPVGLCSGGSS